MIVSAQSRSAYLGIGSLNNVAKVANLGSVTGVDLGSYPRFDMPRENISWDQLVSCTQAPVMALLLRNLSDGSRSHMIVICCGPGRSLKPSAS